MRFPVFLASQCIQKQPTGHVHTEFIPSINRIDHVFDHHRKCCLLQSPSGPWCQQTVDLRDETRMSLQDVTSYFGSRHLN